MGGSIHNGKLRKQNGILTEANRAKHLRCGLVHSPETCRKHVKIRRKRSKPCPVILTSKK